MVSIDRKSYMGFSKNPFWTLKIQNGRDLQPCKSRKQISHEKLSDFDEIWYTTAHLELDDRPMTKYEHFKNSKRWMAAILKNHYLAIIRIARFQ